MSERYEAWIKQIDATTFNVGVYVWRDKGICGPSFSEDVNGRDTAKAWDAAKAVIGKFGYMATGPMKVTETYEGPMIEFPVMIR